MTAGLAVEGLSVDRGGRPVLRNLSFQLAPGAALMVTGGNGAGKSTLLRALAGLIPRAGGTVQLRGLKAGGDAVENPSPVHGRRWPREAVSDEGHLRVRADPHPSWLRHDTVSRGAGEGDADSLDLAEQTSYLGHATGLKLSLTAGENMRFYADWGGGGGASPAEALDSVGLGHLVDIPVGVLSAGQRRRVALARLLVTPRPLWLLDEPATALDAGSEGWLARLLRAHLAASGLLLAAIHNPLDVPARELRLGAA